MGVSITFLGAAGTVTGSKYLIRGANSQILVDAGMFQGDRNWREKNWNNPPIILSEVDATLITHAHIDHIGILPRYVRDGLQSPVFSTRSTSALSGILLPDSAKLQEEEVEFRREKGRSRHSPPLPLYTVSDAHKALGLFQDVNFNSRVEVCDGVFATWYRAGHILGAASILLEIDGKRISFSGDIGRYGVPVLRDPETPPFYDALLIESTYGDRLHEEEDPEEKLSAIINETVKRKGVVLIPSFAVGRCQQILFHLRKLKAKGKIPDIPVVIDSPMADDATAIYGAAVGEYDDEALGIVKRGAHPFSFSKLYFIRDRSESIKLNSIDQPMVIIAASGMLSGGRILHHLKHRISDPSNTVIFVGFQPPGGRGAWILSGAPGLRLFGQEVPIRAQIREISAFSAHGDRGDLLRWCRNAPSANSKPGSCFVVHGEPASAKNFSTTLQRELGWNVSVPNYLEEIVI